MTKNRVRSVAWHFFLLVILIQGVPLMAQMEKDPQQEADTPDRRPGWNIGMGGLYFNRPYRSLKDRFVPLPFLAYRGPKLKVLGPQIAYSVYQSQKISVDVAADWRFAGYDPKDSDYMAGMEKRKDTLEAGFTGEYRIAPKTSAQLKWRVDTLGHHNGHEIEAGIRKVYGSGRVLIAPGIDVSYLSSNLANTYYGVQPSEVVTGRPAYTPGPAHTASVGVMAFIKTKGRTSYILGYRITRLSDELTDSPIISGRVETTSMAGVMWNLN